MIPECECFSCTKTVPQNILYAPPTNLTQIIFASSSTTVKRELGQPFCSLRLRAVLYKPYPGFTYIHATFTHYLPPGKNVTIMGLLQSDITMLWGQWQRMVSWYKLDVARMTDYCRLVNRGQ